MLQPRRGNGNNRYLSIRDFPKETVLHPYNITKLQKWMKIICVCSSEKMNPSKGKIAQFHMLYSCICYGQDSTWWYLYVNMNKYWIHIRRRQNARMKNCEGFCNLSYSLSVSSESHFGVENSILSYQPRFFFCCLYQSPVLLKTHSLPKWILNAFFNLEMPTDEDQFPGSSFIKAG